MYEKDLLEKIESLSERLALLAQDIEKLAKENAELRRIIKKIYAHRVKKRYGR